MANARVQESAVALAVDSIAQKYKDWLEEASTLLSASSENVLLAEGEHVTLPGDIQANMARIAAFAEDVHGSEEMRKSLSGSYSEVRAAALLHLLQPASHQVETYCAQTKTQVGPPGSHPFIPLVRRFFVLARVETRLAAQVLPPSLVGEAVRRSLKAAVEMIQQTATLLSERLHRATGNHEFFEQISILDAVEGCNDLYVENASTSSPVREVSPMLEPTIKILTGAAVDLLKALIDDVQGASRTTAAPPANATVYEQTSSLMNCLKRILVFERVTEALLSRWAQPEWDGLLGPVPAEPSIFAMALYYQDVLKGLEVLLERQSRTYRRAMTSALFQLNNYNYIVKTFRSCSMVELLTLESQKKYECIVDALINEYLLSWQHLSSLLEEGETRSASIAPKERLKAFSSELEDIVHSQEHCAVPDLQLRAILVARIRDLLVPTFVAFYNQHQSIFAASYARTRLDPSFIEATLNKLFQA